ncbi:hypothetical protein SLEP1_g22371 [Rubroshorea leprosula]|uniref:Uncharacterized protein n=1 Tax=Rubroshorea leprosula TaxID=152421 RepID=A0AAV5JF29_9ROSI|nr:hypothetical protein SLEP1_g22371 [Rubroshorea leprosula]
MVGSYNVITLARLVQGAGHKARAWGAGAGRGKGRGVVQQEAGSEAGSGNWEFGVWTLDGGRWTVDATHLPLILDRSVHRLN